MNEIELTKLLVINEVTAPYFCGVLSHDQLNKLPYPKTGFYVCNTDDSTGPGEHWITLAWFRNGQPAEFFDSLAKSPADYNKNFTNFLINNGPKYKFTTVRIQAEESIKCGEFCIFYAHHRCMGYSFEEILKMFSDTDLRSNDIKVEHFVNNL